MKTSKKHFGVAVAP